MIVHAGLLLAGLGLCSWSASASDFAAVPFHSWSPDVYEGSPSPVAGSHGRRRQGRAFAALLRVFVDLGPDGPVRWDRIVWVLALLDLVVGAVVALSARRQADDGLLVHQPRRLHPLGVGAASARGVSASLYYIFAYCSW